MKLISYDVFVDEDRVCDGYYLYDWSNNAPIDACELCELKDDCDRIADTVNMMEYCMCLSQGIVKDIQYKKDHPKAYFRKIK